MVWLWWLWWFWWFLVVVVVLGELDVLVVVAAIRRYRGPALRTAGEMRAGRDVGLRCDQRGSRNDDERCIKGMTTARLLKDSEWRQFQGRTVGDHIQCADETGNLWDGSGQIMRQSAERTKRWDTTVVYLDPFHAFSRSDGRVAARGGPAVPEASGGCPPP